MTMKIYNNKAGEYKYKYDRSIKHAAFFAVCTIIYPIAVLFSLLIIIPFGKKYMRKHQEELISKGILSDENELDNLSEMCFIIFTLLVFLSPLISIINLFKAIYFKCRLTISKKSDEIGGCDENN